MIFIDVIFGCLLGYAFFKGFKQGLIIAVISLFSLMLGILIALKFSFLFKDWIHELTQWNGNVIAVCAFVFTFLLVLVGIQFMGSVLTKIVKTMALGWVNRLGGGFFNVLKMILIISVVLNLFQKINFNHFLISEEHLNQSTFYHPIEDFSKKIYPLMEQWYQATLEELHEKVNDIEIGDK